MEEKRLQKRDILRIEARYNDVAGNVLKGEVLNISLGGAYIHTRYPLNFGSPLNLGLDDVDIRKVFDVHGHVVRVDPGNTMAVEFTHKGDKKIQRLIDMIKRVTFSSFKCFFI
jgi:hypothetical protein